MIYHHLFLYTGWTNISFCIELSTGGPHLKVQYATKKTRQESKSSSSEKAAEENIVPDEEEEEETEDDIVARSCCYELLQTFVNVIVGVPLSEYNISGDL